MDGRASLSNGDMVVNLKGVPAVIAYGWGLEAGVFMMEIRAAGAEGPHVFHAGNLGMIEMIATEAGLDVDVLSSQDDFILCQVSKPKHKQPRIVRA